MSHVLSIMWGKPFLALPWASRDSSVTYRVFLPRTSRVSSPALLISPIITPVLSSIWALTRALSLQWGSHVVVRWSSRTISWHKQKGKLEQVAINSHTLFLIQVACIWITFLPKIVVLSITFSVRTLLSYSMHHWLRPRILSLKDMHNISVT